MKVSGKCAHIDFTFLIREYALVWGVERINGVYANVNVNDISSWCSSSSAQRVF